MNMPLSSTSGLSQSSVNVLDQLDQQGVFFDVRESEVLTADGIVIPGKKALIRQDNDTPLSIVSDSYKTVSNQEVFTEFGRALSASSLDLDGAVAKSLFSHNGGRVMVDMRLPAHQIEVNGDKVDLMITALNSYDGSLKYSVKAGGFRLKCLNGQIVGRSVGGYSAYHNQSLDVSQSADALVRMLQDFHQARDWWEGLMGRPVSDDLACVVIRRFLESSASAHLSMDDFMNKAKSRRLFALWSAYKREMGGNAYALYNAFTDYVTHMKYRDNRQASGLLSKQEKLAGLLSSRSLPEPVFA